MLQCEKYYNMKDITNSPIYLTGIFLLISFKIYVKDIIKTVKIIFIIQISLIKERKEIFLKKRK